jgi:hypothetical protein
MTRGSNALADARQIGMRSDFVDFTAQLSKGGLQVMLNVIGTGHEDDGDA